MDFILNFEMMAWPVTKLVSGLSQIWNLAPQRRLLLLYLALIPIALIPVVSVTYLPAGDLPGHILGAVLHAIGPSTYLSAHWLPSPYILWYAAMYPLIHLLGYLTAAKILIIVYIILFPISILIFFLEYNPKHWYLAFLTLPFIYSYHFELGFIPYCFGIPFVFIGLALARKALYARLSKSNFLLLFIVSTLVYLSHLDDLLAFCLGLLCLGIPRAYRAYKANKSYKTFFLYASRLAIVLSPIIILSLLYLFYLKNYHDPRSMVFDMRFNKPHVQFAAILQPFFSLNKPIDLLAASTIVIILGWLFIREQTWFRLDFPLLFGALMLCLTVVVPRAAFLGSWDNNSRFMVFGFVGILASIMPSHTRMAKIIGILSATIFFINISARTDFYLKIDSMASKYIHTVSQYIPPDQKIYPVYTAFPDNEVAPLLHIISYYHIEKGGYSAFLFTDMPHVAGVQSSIRLPKAVERWNDKSDVTRFPKALLDYDYLIINKFGFPAPKYFDEFDNQVIYQDELCTIIKLH